MKNTSHWNDEERDSLGHMKVFERFEWNTLKIFNNKFTYIKLSIKYKITKQTNIRITLILPQCYIKFNKDKKEIIIQNEFKWIKKKFIKRWYKW